MKRTTLLLLTAMSISGAWATEGNIKGKILDKNSNTPLEFVNIKITSQSDSAKIAGGAISAATAGVLTAALGEAYIGIMTLVFNGEMNIEDLGTKKGKDKMTALFKQELKRKR